MTTPGCSWWGYQPPTPRPVATEWVDGPTLADLKVDAQIDPSDTTKDAAYQLTLDAAIAFVLSVRRDLNFTQDITDSAPAPSKAVFLGTIRLAYRWHTRRRSPDALVSMGDLGSSRVPSFDPDIERLLGIGRFKGPVFA